MIYFSLAKTKEERERESLDFIQDISKHLWYLKKDSDIPITRFREMYLSVFVSESFLYPERNEHLADKRT